MGVVREASECQMETFNSPKKKTRAVSGSMKETQKMGYQTGRKKKERQKDEQSSVALKTHFLHPPMTIFVHMI